MPVTIDQAMSHFFTTSWQGFYLFITNFSNFLKGFRAVRMSPATHILLLIRTPFAALTRNDCRNFEMNLLSCFWHSNYIATSETFGDILRMIKRNTSIWQTTRVITSAGSTYNFSQLIQTLNFTIINIKVCIKKSILHAMRFFLSLLFFWNGWISSFSNLNPCRHKPIFYNVLKRMHFLCKVLKRINHNLCTHQFYYQYSALDGKSNPMNEWVYSEKAENIR